MHDYSSTQISFPPEMAAKFHAFNKSIPDKELAEDGREDEPHCTVKFGIHSASPKSVAKVLKGQPPVKITLGKTALFKNPEHDVLIVEVKSPDLHRLNRKVAKSGPVTDTHPTYQPHATLSYLKKGEGDKYAGRSDFEGMTATIPAVTFSSKDGTKTDIPLDGEPMAKTMAFERKAKRQARKEKPLDPSQYGSLPPEEIPHEAVTEPPNPLATEAMASGGLPVARGNSNEASLTKQGHDTVAKTGEDLGALGGADQIISSPAERTMQTAAAIQATDPKAPPVTTHPGLESQALGNLEGEAKSGDVKKFLSDLVRKHPDYRIPGQGAMSSRQGESFNEFRIRALSAIRGIMQALAQNPHQAIAVPKHSQVSKLVKGWVAKGMPDDLSVDHEAFLKDDSPKPGEVEKFAPNEKGDWDVNKFDPESEKELPKGAIYFIEHGETPATSAKSTQVSSAQRARAELIQAIRSADWKRAKTSALRSVDAGLLTDDDVEQAIDEALPSAEDVADMGPHKLLPIVSAAGKDKRASMLPVLREKMGEMAGASPEAVSALKSHIGRLSA